MKDDQVLAEKRKRTKRVVPEAVALPGGHIKANERGVRRVHETWRSSSNRRGIAIVPARDRDGQMGSGLATLGN